MKACFAGLWACVALVVLGNAAAAQTPAEEILFGDTVLTIGAIQDPIEETFGWIGDAAVGPDGGIFILDYHLPGISWFDSTGALVDVLDGKGAGPGEIRAPRAMAFEPGRTLTVVDPRNVRVSAYDLSDGRFDFVTSYRDRSRARDLCVLEGHHVIAGLRDRKLVQVVDSGGERRRSFGELEVPNDAVARRFDELSDTQVHNLNHTLIACDTVGGRVVLVHRTIPIIQAFDAHGGRLWRTEPQEVIEGEWWVNSRGSVTLLGQDTLMEVSNVTIGDDDRVYMTYWKAPSKVASQDDLETSLELRVLRVSDGQEIARLPVGGRVFAVRDGLAHLHHRYPFPRVVVVRLKDGIGR